MSDETPTDVEIVETAIEQGQDAEEEPTVPAGFSISDESSANWMIRKIVEARTYGRRVAEWAEKEQARACREEQRFLYLFGGQLIDWLRRKIAEQGGRRKSVNLPAGILGFRKENAKLVIDDEGLVVAWAKEHHPELVCIIERISKSKLNDHFDRTGEIPEQGLHIEPQKEKFYVK
ncbi:MAG: host-nuclease inhibitor Gam family protein [Planctomycetes bacterium]|nr:host-nuclease inhibitor Gam family protein [Planctomycetota bacterium]